MPQVNSLQHTAAAFRRCFAAPAIHLATGAGRCDAGDAMLAGAMLASLDGMSSCVYGTDLPQRPPVGIFGSVSKVAEAKCDAAGDVALAHARRISSACGAPIV